MKEGEEYVTVSDGAGGFNFKRKSSSPDSSGGGGCFSSLIVLGLFIGGMIYFLDYLGWIELDSKEHIVNTKGLNLRKAAGTDGEVIKLVKQNDTLWQINDSSQEISNDTWVYVTDKIDTGWVNEQFIK
jgi:uncharacterized protein YgiM (DUF1202 family)